MKWIKKILKTVPDNLENHPEFKPYVSSVLDSTFKGSLRILILMVHRGVKQIVRKQYKEGYGDYMTQAFSNAVDNVIKKHKHDGHVKNEMEQTRDIVCCLTMFDSFYHAMFFEIIEEYNRIKDQTMNKKQPKGYPKKMPKNTKVR